MKKSTESNEKLKKRVETLNDIVIRMDMLFKQEDEIKDHLLRLVDKKSGTKQPANRFNQNQNNRFQKNQDQNQQQYQRRQPFI